jgi:hypothetical protein
MQIKYAVLNPSTGEYTYKDTLEEILEATATCALDFYNLHTHNSPFTTIEVNEDGSEVWKNQQGETILSPADIQARINSKLKTSYITPPTE